MRAYLRYPDGRAAMAETLEDAHGAWAGESATVWIDLPDPTPERLAEAGRLFGLEPESIEDCLSGEQRPRVDDFDRGLFLLLYGVLSPEGPSSFNPHKICFFFLDRLLITVGKESSRTLNRLHARYAQHPDEQLKRGLDLLLYTLIDGLADNYILCADHYEDVLDAFEGDSLSERPPADFLNKLSELRWELIGFRRLIVSQREAISPLAQGAYDHLSTELATRLRHVLDHMTMALELVDGLREILHGSRENYHAQLTERTNSLMKFLTVIATLMMPPTLVAGIYGMNVDLWLPDHGPAAFWYLVGFMALIAVGMYLYFRTKHLL